MFYTPSGGPEGWRALLADPEKHWRTGYSAKALAYCWEEAQGFPRSVRDVFDRAPIPVLRGVEFLFGIPEHKVPLPPLSGRPSQNDLFVLAKTNGPRTTAFGRFRGDERGIVGRFRGDESEWSADSGVKAGRSGRLKPAPQDDQSELVAIMVEGKASESFDKLLSEWKEEMTSGKRERLSFLCELLELSQEGIDHIRYQLLHRTASALIEAARFCAPHALMLVHSFSQSHEHFDDYAAFAKLFGVEVEPNRIVHAGTRGGKELYLGWVTGEAEYLMR